MSVALIIPVTKLVTAEILYFFPDHPHLLQTWIHQTEDMVPGYPVMSTFLKMWEEKMEGPLFQVRIAETNYDLFKSNFRFDKPYTGFIQ